MFNTLKVSFKIDITYAINSFIYTLKHTPMIKEWVPDDLYQNKKAKKCVRLLAIFCTTLKMIGGKFLYLAFLYGLLKLIFPEVSKDIFIHTFFFLSMIGMFINSHILSVGKRKYYAIILMNMNAKKYVIDYFLYDIITTFILNLGSLAVFCIALFKTSFLTPVLLASLVIFLKTIGEAISIYFYQKTQTLLINKMSIYFMILLTGMTLAIGLPLIGITLTSIIYIVFFFITLLLALVSGFYIFRIENYQLIYKKINTLQAVMNSENQTAYNRQMAVEIRKKDYAIDERKIKGKKGYDYFNTIFFLRHKVILSNSAHMFAIISFFLFTVLSMIVIIEPKYQQELLQFITNHFAWMILVMYFVNRGAIMTQAMFYNCDRSMLTFRFYREPKVILNLFRERLKTIIRVNLLPALIIGIGLVFLLTICSHTFEISYLFILLSIIFLSIFFSTHYLVIYYLLQPYNINMEMKSISFSVASFLTYFICYLCKDITLSFLSFSLLIIIVTILYIILSLIIIYKKSPETFQLK